MLYVKLQYLRLLRKEYDRLFDIWTQMANCRDSEKKKEYYADYAQCGKEKDRLLAEDLLKGFPLSKAEMVMARSFYYEGKEWEDAFDDAADTFVLEKYDLYYKNGKLTKMGKQQMGTMKKSILRKIQKYTKYQRKTEES